MLQLVDFSWPELVAAALVLLAASYVRGLTGFGLSAVLVAGLSFFVDPARAVPVALSYEVIGSAIQAPSVRAEVRWRTLGLLIAGSIVGNPFGLFILANAEPDVLRAMTYGVLLVLSLALLHNAPRRIEGGRGLFLAVGLLAGVVNGATALSGLVLVVALSFIRVTPSELRATLVVYFLVTNVLVVTVLVATDAVGPTDGWRVVVGLPLLVAGIAIGTRTFRGLAPEQFRTITVCLLLCISAFGMLRVVLA